MMCGEEIDNGGQKRIPVAGEAGRDNDMTPWSTKARLELQQNVAHPAITLASWLSL